MSKGIPNGTITTFARSIFREARRYGFGELDIVRLINAILDVSAHDAEEPAGEVRTAGGENGSLTVDSFPLRSEQLQIRQADPATDIELLRNWIDDEYGRHFLLSSATAQPTDLESLLTNPQNEVGIVLQDDVPIGGVAYLDIDPAQRRAELRKLIGMKSARGKGLAEAATRLWIQYGGERLRLEKIYVSTLQTHLRNIQLNESIGFRVEGVLHREVEIEGERYDVLRMGLCFSEYCRARTATE